MGLKPSKKTLPWATGLKALYWRTQKSAPHFLQGLQQWNSQPNAGAADRPRAATPSTVLRIQRLRMTRRSFLVP
jgi:hypothetical protein